MEVGAKAVSVNKNTQISFLSSWSLHSSINDEPLKKELRFRGYITKI